MKSNFKILPLAAVLGAVVWAGCQTQYPTSYSHLASSAGLVTNFESGLGVNPGLAEANKPGNQVQTAGTISATGNPSVTPLIVSPGANNTAHCVHMFATFQDQANGGYPAALLSIPLEAAGNHNYDASFFTEVQFYIKVAVDDNASTRSFIIPIAPTVATTSGGTCVPNPSSGGWCYANFSATYPATNGSWQLITLPFASITRPTYGVPLTPSTFSGVNLQQILSLEWSEGNNNVAGNVTADFYVDEVQFY